MPHPETFFIRPAKGLRIADPKSGEYLPEKGAVMPRSGFWLRRLKEGDVTEDVPESPVAETEAGPAKKTRKAAKE